MARRPYLFCRVQISAEGAPLTAAGTRQFLLENQGKFREHPVRGDRPPANAVIMECKPVETDDDISALSFYVGYQPGFRTKTGYDAAKQQRTVDVVPDDNIRSAHAVIVPELGGIAIEDRQGENNIPQGVAISALRSIVTSILDEGELDVIHLSDADVRRIIQKWELIQYDYSVRPLNPIELSDFSNLRSEAMKKDNAAVDSGTLRPNEGDALEDNGGILTATQEVVDSGYGQSGGRAIAPGGFEARFPKPKFHLNKEKNFKEREKPRFLKILFDENDDGSPDDAAIVKTLVDFYRNDFEA